VNIEQLEGIQELAHNLFQPGYGFGESIHGGFLANRSKGETINFKGGRSICSHDNVSLLVQRMMAATGNHYLDRNKTLSLCSRVRATSDSANNNQSLEAPNSLKDVVAGAALGHTTGAGGCGLSLIGYGDQILWPTNSMRQSLISHQQYSVVNPLHFQLSCAPKPDGTRTGTMQFDHQQSEIQTKFETILRENEEFLISFEVCKEDLSQQVKSLLFQLEKIRKLYAVIEELSSSQIASVIHYSNTQ
jgi:hypothetical protein